VVSGVVALWREHAVKFVRYCGLSVFNVVSGQSLLALFVVLGFEVVVANLLAVAIGTVPAYLLARRFVWQTTGRHSVRREVLPFWVLNFLGLLLSSLSTSYAHRLWGDQVLLINLASISAWFVVWVLKYLLLDRAVFRAKADEVAAAPVTV